MASEEPTEKEPRAETTQHRARAKKAEAKPSRAPDEGEPVLSGRLVLVATLFVAMVFIPLSPLSMLISRKPPAATQAKDWKVGEEATVHLTVITADYNKLACAHPDPVGDYHCANLDEKKPWPREADAPLDDNKKQVIQPYRTTDGSLLMIAGLWAQPVVATRLHREPPHAVPEKKLARFVVECRVKILAEWQEPLVRWAPGQSWSRQGNAAEGKARTAPVAQPLTCRILERKRTS